MSDAALHSLYAVAEPAYGQPIPFTDWGDDLFHVRNTGVTVGLAKNGLTSEELHADRQIKSFRHGSHSVSGDVNFELSVGTFDNFIEAALCGTWAANAVSAGTQRRSFALLRYFADITPAADAFVYFKGCELGGFTLTMPTDGIVTGSFNVVGQTQVDPMPAEVLTKASSLPAPTCGEVLNTTGGMIFSEGNPLAVLGYVTEASITLANGIAPRLVVGSPLTIRPSIGRSNLTGNITVYFENQTLLRKFINETASALRIDLKDEAGNGYRIDIPRIKYSGGQPDVSGEGPITLSMPFQALGSTDCDTGTLTPNITVTKLTA